MGSIVKTQIKILVENLLHYEYIYNKHGDGITIADKIFDDLQAVDEIISKNQKMRR